MRLQALMRLPGRAELEFLVVPRRTGSLLVQTARFAPRGPGGYLYWYGLLPIHTLVFRGMATAIVRRAAARQRLPTAVASAASPAMNTSRSTRQPQQLQQPPRYS